MTSGCCEPGAGPLAARLLRPAQAVGLAGLPALWFTSWVLLRCRGAGALAIDPAVPGKIRGAFGRALAQTASFEAVRGLPCPWQPPCALDALFRCQGHITPALELPKPYVLALLQEDGDLLVRLTLFGFATEWTEMALEALVRALRGPLSLRQPLVLVDRRYGSDESVAVAEVPDALVMAFATPLQLRRRQRGGVDVATTVAPAEGGDFVSLVSSLGNRVSGLARWQDTEVVADWKEIKAAAGAVGVRPLTRLPTGWHRYSRRQERWIPAAGVRTTLLLQGGLRPLLPLLAIGTTTHAGSHATLGQGRYELLVPNE
jgi:hypothetical protein